MFANVIYLILGFIIGFLVAIVLGAGGRGELEDQIAALESQNSKLQKQLEDSELE